MYYPTTSTSPPEAISGKSARLAKPPASASDFRCCSAIGPYSSETAARCSYPGPHFFVAVPTNTNGKFPLASIADFCAYFCSGKISMTVTGAGSFESWVGRTSCIVQIFSAAQSACTF